MQGLESADRLPALTVVRVKVPTFVLLEATHLLSELGVV